MRKTFGRAWSGRVTMRDVEVGVGGAAVSPKHLSALRLVYERLGAEPPMWVVTGSLAFALRGMDIVVHDIDLQTDRAGAYEIERRLNEFVVEPVCFSSSATIRSHFGALSMHGVKVEIMGDIEKRNADSDWEPPAALAQSREWVAAYGMSIPVLSLEHEYQAYRTLGRAQRADMLKQWMEDQRHGHAEQAVRADKPRPR